MFTGAIANKYGGTCFYCARRVPREAGWAWRDGSVWQVAHSACVCKQLAEGKPPVREETGRAAHLVRAVRAALSRVRLDSPAAELEAAAESVRRAVADDLAAVEDAADCAAFPDAVPF